MRLTVRRIAIVGMLGSLTVALGLAPVGGFIPVPTPAGSATTMHLPAILAGILEGPLAGAGVGFIFGAFSFWRAQFSANPVARLMFTDPLVAFVPRILIGVAAAYAFRLAGARWTRPLLAVAVAGIVAHSAYVSLDAHPALVAAVAAAAGAAAGYATHRVARHQYAAPMLAAMAGTLTNTVGVLGLVAWRGYLPPQAAVAVGILHGLPEILVAMILVAAVHRAVARSLARQSSRPALEVKHP